MRHAEAALLKAQKDYDELYLLRRRHSESLRARLLESRKKRQQTRVQSKPSQPRPDPVDHPKPANQLLSAEAKVRRIERTDVSPTLAHEVFKETNSLDGTAARLNLGRKTIIYLLREAGIDVVEDMALKHERGTPLRELSRRNGPGISTISRWIKSTGRTVRPGSSITEHSEKEILSTYEKCGVPNQTAESCRKSWATIRSVLVKHGKWGGKLPPPT